MLIKHVPVLPNECGYRLWLPIVWLAVFVCAADIVRADVAAIPPVAPAATKILILPTLDTTADRPEMEQEHIVTSDHRLAYEFLIRGFPVLAPDVAQRAARTNDIDLTAPDERTRKNLKVLGQTAGATWVVALTVMEVREARSGSWLNDGGQRQRSRSASGTWQPKPTSRTNFMRIQNQQSGYLGQSERRGFSGRRLTPPCSDPCRISLSPIRSFSIFAISSMKPMW